MNNIITILNNLAENIQEDSSAYEGSNLAEAERDMIKYFLELLENDPIITHQGLVSRLHEIEVAYPKL